MRRDVTDYRNLRRRPRPSRTARWGYRLCQLIGLVFITAGSVCLAAGGGALLLAAAGQQDLGFTSLTSFQTPLWLIPGVVLWYAGGALGNYGLNGTQ